MADSFTISGAIHSSPKFLRCGVLARYLFQSMIVNADPEGRSLSDPLHWQQLAALWGPSETPLEGIASAIDELQRERLVVVYGEGGKFLFMPGRFKHNPGRTYWKKSKFPLPAVWLLCEHPDYLGGLARLCTDGRLRDTDDGSRERRYPQLLNAGAGSSTDTDENSRENVRKTAKDCEKPRTDVRNGGPWAGVGVGVGVGVGEKKGNRDLFDAATSNQNAREATKSQLSKLGEIAEERGKELQNVARE